jgi:hypothetical protein
MFILISSKASTVYHNFGHVAITLLGRDARQFLSNVWPIGSGISPQYLALDAVIEDESFSRRRMMGARKRSVGVSIRYIVSVVLLSKERDPPDRLPMRWLDRRAQSVRHRQLC